MKKYSLKRSILTLLAFCTTAFSLCSTLVALPETPVHESKVMSIVELIGVTTYDVVHTIYDKFKTYIHVIQTYVSDVVAQETVDAIILIATPYAYINNLPAVEKETMQRKQARLFKIRDRVIQKLHARMDELDKGSELSANHKKNILAYINKSEKFCKVFDALRHTNPYEKDYEKPSFLDKFVENGIVNSIILSSKPDQECTQKELDEKRVLKKRSEKVTEKLRVRLKGIAFEAIKTTGVFFARLFI